MPVGCVLYYVHAQIGHLCEPFMKCVGLQVPAQQHMHHVCKPCFLTLLYRSIMLDFQADAHGHVSHGLQDDRQQQLGKWRGTISGDRSRPSSPSPSYASYAATRSSQVTSNYSAASNTYPRAPPSPPQTRPLSRGSSPPSSSSPDPGDLSQNDHLLHYAACLLSEHLIY